MALDNKATVRCISEASRTVDIYVECFDSKTDLAGGAKVDRTRSEHFPTAATSFSKTEVRTSKSTGAPSR